MNSAEPSIEQWRQAYGLAAQIHALAPWEWMCDTDHLAFRDPEDGSPRFVAVMGQLGEHYAVTVYRREEDVFRIIDLARDPDSGSEVILETSQLQLSFEDRDFLDPAERRVIKRLGLRFRGRQAWPCFRSYLPGQFPWFIDSDELRQVIPALELVLDMAPRFRDDEQGLERLNRLGMDDHVFLMRTPTKIPGTIEWTESMVEIQRPAPTVIVPEMDDGLLRRVGRFPVVDNRLEIDLRSTPWPVQEQEDQRPYFPWVVLVVESDEGIIVGHELLTPLPTLDAVYSRAAGALLDVLERNEIRPAEILVRSDRVAALFREVCAELGIALTVQPCLPQVKHAFASMLRFYDEG
jgi:hypothetical protein